MEGVGIALSIIEVFNSAGCLNLKAQVLSTSTACRQTPLSLHAFHCAYLCIFHWGSMPNPARPVTGATFVLTPTRAGGRLSPELLVECADLVTSYYASIYV